MKKLLIIFFVCFGFLAKAQVFTPMTAAGYQNKRTKTDSTNYIPTFCGVPTLRSTTAQKQGAIALDSCNKIFYFYDPKTETWNQITGGGSTINIFNDTTILICSGTNVCDTFITNVTANYVSIFNDSTLIVCNTEGACDTININPTNFGVSVVSFTKNATQDSIILILSDNTRYAVRDNNAGFDTTTVYQNIQNVYNYFSDTSFTNQFFPRGDGVLLDTVIRITDSTLRFIYTDGTQKEDTFRIALTQENITNITNIINLIDSLRGNDTTFILSASNLQSGLKALYSTSDSLSGNDTLHLEFPHNNIAEDSVLTTDVDGDLKMKLVTSGTGGGIDSVRQTIATDSIKEYSGGVGTLAVRAQRVFNVKQNYGGLGGAKGDGVTDDTRAIQAAINAAYAAGGGKVYFPNGIYIIGDTLNTTAVFSGGIRYGGSNSQLYIPDNQTPFQTHPLISIEFVGETAPNMFMSRLVPYPINRSGAVLYSTITGSVTGGVYPSILGAAGDGWAYGNINDVQVSIRNINFRVKANIATTGPTMGAVDLHKISSIGYWEDVLCDVDTALYYAVYPTAVTFGLYLPYANNSAFNPINSIGVGGYKYGYIFSEHTTGNNLSASVNEYGFLIRGAPHGESFGRMGAQWNKYTIATASPDFAALGASYLNIAQLDIEQDTVTSSWTLNRYVIYDSTNNLQGDITYHNVNRGTGVIESAFNKLGGTNAKLQLRAIGSYPDTTTRFTGFATLAKVYNDSVALQTAIATKEPALGNPGTSGYILSSTTGGVRSWVPQSSGLAGVFSRYGAAGTDSLKAVATNYNKIGVYDTAISRFSVTTNDVGTTVNDTSGISSVNKTPATVGVQKYSPYNSQTAQGWSTTGSASHSLTFGTYVQPVQAGTVTGNLIWGYGLDHATPSTVLTLNSVGLLTTTALTNNGAFTSTGGTSSLGVTNVNSTLTVGVTSQATTPTDRLVVSNGTSSTSGVPQQYSPALNFSGTAWDGSASRTALGRNYLATINGTSPITAKLVWGFNINAGGYNDRMALTDAGSLGVGTTSPNAASILDLTSTTKGLLLPRMTKTQRDAIASPVAGLAIYQTDNTPGLRVYNGTNWMKYTEATD